MVEVCGVSGLGPGGVDRCVGDRGEPGLVGEVLGDVGTRVLEVVDGCVPVVRGVGGGVGLVFRSPVVGDEGRGVLFVGRVGGVAVVAVCGGSGVLAGGGVSWLGVREAGELVGEVDREVLLTAVALVNWHERSGFCCRCGAPTRVVSAGWVRVCSVEGVEFFPRTDPAVIVAVTDVRGRLLLARNVGWEVRRRSLLAGFVDAGEGASDAVVREVAEEVGVRVRGVEFVADQPWPFPGSLMLGFVAEAVDVGLCLDASEIAQAQWYSREELRVAVGSGEVRLPGRLSIARRLIERWYGGPLVGVGEVLV